MLTFKPAVWTSVLALLGQRQHASAAEIGKNVAPKIKEMTTTFTKPDITNPKSKDIPIIESARKKSYIAIMSRKPIIGHEGDSDGFEATQPAQGEKIDPSSENVKIYKEFLEEEQIKAAGSVGIPESELGHQYVYSLNGFQAFMTKDQAVALSQQEGVLKVVEDEMRFKTTDTSSNFLGLTNPGGPWAADYDGEGVVVGVIDTGVWPEHPSFADDGTYAPLSNYTGLPCEFGNTAHNVQDAPFTCNNKLLGARQVLDTYRAQDGAEPDEFDSARDDDGHGSHTAGTSAGNAGVEATVLGVIRAGPNVLGLGRANSVGGISGVAPRARVIVYKGLGVQGGFSSDLAMCIDLAVADGVDVINYSVGGAPSLTGVDDIAFLYAEDAGVFVATSAGNSGPGPETIGGPGSVPWITTVGASTQSRSYRGSAVSSDGWEFFGASLTAGTDEVTLVDAADAGDELCTPDALDEGVVGGNIVLCKRGQFARSDKSLAVQLAGGAGMILYNQDDDQSLSNDAHWIPSVQINNSDGVAIKSYIASAGIAAVAQIKGGTITFARAPDMADFSSRGPNEVARDIIKPDITGPGVEIMAAWTPYGIGSVPDELFASISGTSMSSPHIAGAFALIKQAHPEWTPSMAKSAIMTTAHQNVKKEDGSTAAEPFDFGAGHIAIGSVGAGSPFQPGLVYRAGFFEYAGFICDADPGYWTQESCEFLESIDIPTEAINLNYPSVGVSDIVGLAAVNRTVTSVASGLREFEVIVDAPEGWDVIVSPSTLSLEEGESATFELRMTNVNGPRGEWAYGSLKWVDSSGYYEVHSPIALRASENDLIFPDEIDEFGVDGGASFGITFGYNGGYAANAHGLEPATVTSDTVVQDPDLSFDPNDGYSNMHQFDLSGAAYFRIALPPDSVADLDMDLDIFLFDPNGDFFGQSWNIGTDEQIDVILPMDGTWTLFVHGYDTVGPSAAYDLYTWIVSGTPGGNMSVDSAPDSAVIGDDGLVTFSWTAAAAGEWHLGAISHTNLDSDTLGGLTLVNVDNRSE